MSHCHVAMGMYKQCRHNKHNIHPKFALHYNKGLYTKSLLTHTHSQTRYYSYSYLGMSTRVTKVARSFKTASSAIYLLAILCSATFAFDNFYLEAVTGCFTAALCLVMIIATLDKPRVLVDKLSNSRFDFMFTLKGRALLDIITALFLFAMGGFGFFLATIVCGLLLGIIICGQQMPELLSELFHDTANTGEIDDASASVTASYSRG